MEVVAATMSVSVPAFVGPVVNVGRHSLRAMGGITTSFVRMGAALYAVRNSRHLMSKMRIIIRDP